MFTSIQGFWTAPTRVLGDKSYLFMVCDKYCVAEEHFFNCASGLREGGGGLECIVASFIAAVGVPQLGNCVP